MALRRKPSLVKPDWLIIGLGNPGDQFRKTRHNMGADAVRLLAQGLEAEKLKNRFQAQLWLADLATDEGGATLVLANPATYMNQSGDSVRRLVRHWGFYDWERLIIVHDELDLPPGSVKIKTGGGLGGHNGLISIRARLGTSDFLRIRLGIGKPPSKELGADYVLSRPPPQERQALEFAMETAAGMICEIVTLGLKTAISRQN